MSFDRPGWLLAGIAGVVVFTLLYRWFSLRKTSRDLAYSNVAFFVAATKPRPWIPAVLTLLWILSLGGIALALGGPHLVLPVPARDGSVFICIDTSGSMASTDIVPTRAEAANAAARTFIAASPAGTKIGIIAFSGAAGIVQPLSADHEAVSQSLDQVPYRTARPRSATRCSWLRATCRPKAIASSFSSPTA